MTKLDKRTKELLHNHSKRWAWIIYQLSIQGRTLADVARAAGVTRQAIYQTRRIRYPHMQKLIADALGLQPQELFPERYDSDGLPIKLRGGVYYQGNKHTTADNRCNINCASAA